MKESGEQVAGAVRLDRFMAAANEQYYTSRDPFSDFTTAPEISQIFGELLGAWAVCVWQAMQCPAEFLLVEAGPGRGTLMQDALRSVRHIAPAFAAAARVHLIEISRRLRAEQAARIAEAEWHDSVLALPDGPMIVLANEFLDALPIRQFVRRNGGWRERHVLQERFLELACDDAGIGAGDEGEIFEESAPSRTWVRQVAARLAAHGGAALIVDYGMIGSSFGDSLQALRNREPADPLREPGCADLTAFVRFSALAQVAREAGARVHGPVMQADFLRNLGIAQRLEALCAANRNVEGALRDSVDRLTAPSHMGSLFKAMAVSHPALQDLPGFCA